MAVDSHRGRGQQRARRALLLGVAATLGLVTGVAPERADASVYEVRECNASFNAGTDGRQWYSNGAAYTWADGCAAGWGQKIWMLGGTNAARTAFLYWNAPPGTSFQSASMLLDGAHANGNKALVQMCSGGCSSVYADAADGWQAHNTGAGNQFRHVLQCEVSGGCAQGGWSAIANLSLAIDDYTPPAPGDRGGSLLAEGVKRGVERVSFSATDVGGGVRRGYVEVNDTVAASSNAGCAFHPSGPATSLVPCPGGQSFSYDVNTETAPFREGPNKVRVCTVDAGNNTVCTAAQTVNVDNACEGSGGTEASALAAGIDRGGRLRPSAVVRSTQGVTIRGVLKGAGGEGVQGKICVFEHVEGQQGRELVAVPRSKADGSFAANLAAGPSRKIELAYRFNNKQIEQTLYVDSVAVPVLKLTRKRLRNGGKVGFRGWIPGPNSEGRAVAVQALANPGKRRAKWRTFKVLRTRKEGRFKGLFRFTQTRGKQLYTFRVSVKGQAGYPFNPGKSKPKNVIVIG